jgi:uncharacterized LabA/DUF88 family protein
MSDGSGLLDVLMDSGDGGSSGRRGGRRVDSMIAGRRKPNDDNGSDSESKSKRRSSGSGSRSKGSSQSSAKSSSSRSSSRSRSRSTSKTSAKKKDEATTQAKADDQATAKKDDEEKKPARRRRTTRAKAKPKATEQEPVAEDEAASEEVSEAPEEPEVAEATDEPEEQAAPTRSAPRALSTNGDLPAAVAKELGDLRALVEDQRSMLSELRAGLTAVAEATDRSGYRPRLGVFVDVPNVMYGVDADAKPVHMGKLLDYLAEGRELVRATAYSPVSDDPREPIEQQKFVAPFVPYNYRITTKPLKRFADGSIKGNFDVEMALDMLQMADRLDVLCIVSGDADFSRAVEAVQTRGVRVEVVAFAGSASIEMRALADRYIQLDGMVDRIT